MYNFVDAVFFEVSALFLFFLAVGKYIETYAKGSTSGALVHLMRMQPEKALVVHIAEESPEDGVSTSWSSLSRMPHIVSERSIPASRVLVGSVVKVVPGDKIPVDGEVRFYRDDERLNLEKKIRFFSVFSLFCSRYPPSLCQSMMLSCCKIQVSCSLVSSVDGAFLFPTLMFVDNLRLYVH